MNDRVALKPGKPKPGQDAGDEKDFVERLRAGDAAASETLVRANIG